MDFKKSVDVKKVSGFNYWFQFYIQGTNNSESLKEELYDTPVGNVLLVLNVLVIVSSVISLIYIHFYLKLNIFLKAILYQMTILGIVGSVIMITALGIILVTSEQSFMTCSMIYYPGVLVANLDVTMISMISGLRYVLKIQLIAYVICIILQIYLKYFQKKSFQILHVTEGIKSQAC